MAAYMNSSEEYKQVSYPIRAEIDPGNNLEGHEEALPCIRRH